MPELARAAEAGDGRLRALHQRRLGDLQARAAPGAPPASAAITRSGKPGSSSSRAETLTLTCTPAGTAVRLGAGLTPHPVADRGDQARVLLGHRQEAARREQAVLRVLPAYERLDGDDAARVQREDRLVHAAAARPARSPRAARLDPQPVAQPPAHARGRTARSARAAARLGALHGGVGALDRARRPRGGRPARSRSRPRR